MSQVDIKFSYSNLATIEQKMRTEVNSLRNSPRPNKNKEYPQTQIHTQDSLDSLSSNLDYLLQSSPKASKSKEKLTIARKVINFQDASKSK